MLYGCKNHGDGCYHHILTKVRPLTRFNASAPLIFTADAREKGRGDGGSPGGMAEGGGWWRAPRGGTATAVRRCSASGNQRTAAGRT
uniref:Uncharacterized protein K0063H06.43 n=1 Tax=Oryza sativa subsp. indica TaxID=39946 RepID=C8TF29_ORYSI|nr:hypothetical protein [Oryza sativa Indica Group]